MSQSQSVGRPAEIAFDELTYRLTPVLVRSLTSVYHQSGLMAGARLSNYRAMRLQNDASERRVRSLVGYVRTGVGREDVAHVLRGDALLPPREGAARDIRHVALLDSAARYFGERRQTSTAEICATYLDLMFEHGVGARTHWSRFTGMDRERALAAHVRSAEPPAPVRRLYAHIAADALLSQEPVLRSALVHWALSMLFGQQERARPAIESVVIHELRAGGIDPFGILALRSEELQDDWLHPALVVVHRMDPPGDLTPVFERFANSLGLALTYAVRRLGKVQDAEERLAWAAHRPPDDLDRQIFEAVERLGSATSAAIIEGLRPPAPPLRTLQRRLQHLVADGLIVKHGARRDAFYQVSTTP